MGIAQTPGGSGSPQVTGAAGHVRTCFSRTGEGACERIDPERISEVIRQESALLWVDVQDPGQTELEMLREEFGFHRLALEDVARQRQRPKVDEYPGYYFVVLYAPRSPSDATQAELAEVDLFVGPNYVVSIHPGEVQPLVDALRQWERTDAELRRDVGFLLHTLTDTIIDAYFPLVDAIEDRLDDMELTLFAPRGRFSAEELLRIKRRLFALRKAVYPMREVFNQFLRRDTAIFSAETYPYFQDVYDHVLRLLDTLDIQRDMATGTLEAQLAVVSNRLNETMQRLTVVTVCLAVLGAVFGAWGMNFDEVPLHALGKLGFYLVSGGALALVGLVLLLARRYRLW